MDTGAKPLALLEGETVTEGLDGLRERLAEYRELGARFAKWRATYFIGDELPTDFAVLANGPRWHGMRLSARKRDRADRGARDVDGWGPDLAACEDATGRALQGLYEQMTRHRIDLAGTLLKVNMVVPGKGAAAQADDRAIAEATLRTLRAHVPDEVPGIVFLSGG